MALPGWQSIVRDPQLYELLKYCPLDIAQRWRLKISAAPLSVGRRNMSTFSRYRLPSEVDVFCEG